MQAFNRVRDLALIAGPRMFFFSAQCVGAMMFLEVASRIFAKTASTTGGNSLTNWADKHAPTRVKDLKNQIFSSDFVQGLRPFNNNVSVSVSSKKKKTKSTTRKQWSTLGLIKTGTLCFVLSGLGLRAMEAIVGKPHEAYNKILSNISYLQVRIDGSPFTSMKETFGQIKTRVFG